MGMALEVAKLSNCSRLHVGALILNSDFRILGEGYNGRPAGTVHCKDDNPDGIKELCNCIHAEINALNFCIPYEGEKIAFVTAFPCPNCLKALYIKNVKKVYYNNPYRYFEESSKSADYLGIEYERVIVDAMDGNN